MKKIVVLILLFVLMVSGCNVAEKPDESDVPTVVENEEPEPGESTPAPEQKHLPEPSDDELVKVTDYIPDIIVELRYATTNNFTGVVIYEDSTAYLRYGTVKKLSSAQEKLKKKGCLIKIWDAYRPVSAQRKLWEVYPDPSFVANPNKGYSGHSRGDTVDITITDLNGAEIPMPSAFDEFGNLADRDYSDVSDEARNNSIMLENIMEECGFNGYVKEWWHYSDVDEYSVIKE